MGIVTHHTIYMGIGICIHNKIDLYNQWMIYQTSIIDL